MGSGEPPEDLQERIELIEEQPLAQNVVTVPAQGCHKCHSNQDTATFHLCTGCWLTLCNDDFSRCSQRCPWKLSIQLTGSQLKRYLRIDPPAWYQKLAEVQKAFLEAGMTMTYESKFIKISKLFTGVRALRVGTANGGIIDKPRIIRPFTIESFWRVEPDGDPGPKYVMASVDRYDYPQRGIPGGREAFRFINEGPVTTEPGLYM